MSHYRSMDGEGEDDADIVIQEGTEKVEKCTRRMHSKIALLENRDSPTLRKQIEEEHRKGNDIIAEVKAEIRTAKKTARVVEAEREFRDACTQFRQAYAQFQNPGSSSSGARMHDDGGSGSGGNSDSMSGQHPSGASEQSLTLLMESEDVDALLEAENREDALRLARDTAILRETMADAVDLIEEGGEQLLEVDNTMESATRDAESAAVELTKAREHQKATQKLKIIIGSICACIILCVIVIPLVMKFGTAPGSNPLNPSTELTGFLIQQSSTPSTCSTNSATMCLYRCGQEGYTAKVTNSATLALTPYEATLTSSGCEDFACPTGTGTVSGTTATGSFADSYGTTFTATPSNGAIVFAEMTGTGRTTSCDGTFSVQSGSFLGVAATV